TISSKTKPSSRALHPIEDAYFHQSHLKGKQDYGHQAVAVMLSCNGIVLNYALVMYDKWPFFTHTAMGENTSSGDCM
ncbi:MAG: hypothetical protein MR436_00585, partial [Eubacterium sp.]|nr:hypothetical protein [Eubacterium sp.]